MSNQLPSVNNATLPQTYIEARTALQKCSKLDECQDWANKAEAMASYAKQAKDDTLRKMADRIQARAIRRCGELLKQIDRPSQGGRPKKNEDGTDHVTVKSAAQNAGLSERQQKTAIRVANVDAGAFESLVESDDPPTISALSEIGKTKSVKNFKRATEASGTLRYFAKFCEENDPNEVANGVLDHEKEMMKKWVVTIDSWLDVFITRI